MAFHGFLTGSALALAAITFPLGKALAQAPASTRPALPPYTGTTLDAVFAEWVKRHHPRTAILVVRRNGKTVFQKGHNADPAKPTFIASLTKSYTGICVATLIRDGKLAFTTPMKDALPKLLRQIGPHADSRFPDVTVEQLLTHRSGLLGNSDGDPIHGYIRRLAAAGQGGNGSVQPMLAEHYKNRLVRDPGGNASYSNTGYVTLTAIIEERTGRNYEDYCGEAVFGKLGLPRARLHPDWRVLSGGGGLFIPAPDYLAMYDVFDPANPFLGDTVKTWIDQAQTKWSPGNKAGWYSLGVETNSNAGRWYVQHGGLLNSRGKDAHGKSAAALIVSRAARAANGTAVFLAIEWSEKSGEMFNELWREVARLNRS